MKFKELHHNIKIRLSVMFIFGIAQATTTPFMAIYFATHFGAQMTGVLLTMSIFASVISGFIGGHVADQMGRRKILIIVESVFLLAYLAMAIANSPWFHSATSTFISFLLINACWGVYGPVDEAMILDVTDVSNRPYVYSLFYWMFNLTLAIGASIGALTFNAHRFLLFSGTVFVLLIALFTTIFMIQETFDKITMISEKKSLWRKVAGLYFVVDMVKNYASIARDRSFLQYGIAGLLVMTVESELQTSIGIRLQKEIQPYNWNVFSGVSLHIGGLQMIGLLQTENTILVVLLASFAGRIASSMKDRAVMIIGILLFTIGYTVITISNTPSVLFLAMGVATAGEVFSIPLRQSYLGVLAPIDKRSTYLAANGLTFNGARMLASISVIGSAFMSTWQMGALNFLLGSTGGLLYLLLIPAIIKRRDHQSLV